MREPKQHADPRGWSSVLLWAWELHRVACVVIWHLKGERGPRQRLPHSCTNPVGHMPPPRGCGSGWECNVSFTVLLLPEDFFFFFTIITSLTVNFSPGRVYPAFYQRTMELFAISTSAFGHCITIAKHAHCGKNREISYHPEVKPLLMLCYMYVSH